MKKILSFILIALTALFIFADSIVCPVCDSDMCHFTGNREYIGTQSFKEYRCHHGHIFLVRQW